MAVVENGAIYDMKHTKTKTKQKQLQSHNDVFGKEEESKRKHKQNIQDSYAKYRIKPVSYTHLTLPTMAVV